MSEYVRVVDVKPGDRLVGFSDPFIVDRVAYAGESAYGGSVERQRYRVESTDGRSITYAGDSKCHVIR
jgi:hypothetical protein